MNRPDTVDLDLGEYSAPVHIHEATTEVSPHTGNELQVLKGEIHATGSEMHDIFTQALTDQGARGIWAQDHPSLPRRRWVVSRGNYSVTNDRYRYHVTMREAEDLEITVLVAAGIELEPYRYQEDTHDREITTIKAMVRVGGEQKRRLADLIHRGGYFDVIRKGINEGPIEARFGMCGWSEHGDECKYFLIIVPRARDTGEPEYISAVERFNRQDSLAYRIELMEAMLGLLVEKGILTDTEVEAAREIAAEKIPERRQQFRQVRDADELKW